MSINLEALDPEEAMRTLQRQRAVKMLTAALGVVLALALGIAIVAVGFSGGPAPEEPSGDRVP